MHHLRELARRPELTTGSIQILKSVLAATLAWWTSITLLDSELPFLAPWTALLTLHTTVYRSVSRGTQTIFSSALGVLVSFLIGNYLGVSLWTFALALFVGLVISLIPWIRDEGVAVATTAIFVLSSGFGAQQPLLLDRIFEVGLGVAIGVTVNVIFVPPLRDLQAHQYVDSINRRIGDTLTGMADEFTSSWERDRADAWFREIESMKDELATAWQAVNIAHESRRLNPRTRIPALRRHRNSVDAKANQTSYIDVLARVDETISHLRHLARTLDDVTQLDFEWDSRFSAHWGAIMRDAGKAIADPDAQVEPIASRITSLSQDMVDDQLPREDWTIYGSLITSTRQIAVIIDDVAFAREARSPSGDPHTGPRPMDA